MRSFHLLHTDLGALSIVLWYRPPCYNEISSINDLFPECEKHGKESIGTIIIGDLNVHHKPWLQFSNGISPEGRVLFEKCCVQGFQQCVRQPTRGEYLLDLVLANVEELVTSKVVQKICDHNLVLSTISTNVSETDLGKREVWEYDKADWKSIENIINEKIGIYSSLRVTPNKW